MVENRGRERGRGGCGCCKGHSKRRARARIDVHWGKGHYVGDDGAVRVRGPHWKGLVRVVLGEWGICCGRLRAVVIFVVVVLGPVLLRVVSEILSELGVLILLGILVVAASLGALALSALRGGRCSILCSNGVSRRRAWARVRDAERSSTGPLVLDAGRRVGEGLVAEAADVGSPLARLLLVPTRLILSSTLARPLLLRLPLRRFPAFFRLSLLLLLLILVLELWDVVSAIVCASPVPR